MTKLRKSFIGALLCAMMLLIGVCALTACGSKDMTVTFSIEGKEQTVDVVDGKVDFPADPIKEYYEFRGWYTTETFDEGTEFTKDSEVKGNITVYAYLVPIRVDISLNGGEAEEINLENLSAKTEEFTSDAASKELTFDGWYVDSNYGTKYSTQDTDKLYGRYMAQLEYNNGYETLYTELVTPGETISVPDGKTDGFVKRYMDAEDISYADSDGNAIDFSRDTFDKNEVITVLWKTPGLVYTEISGQSGKYSVSNIDGTDYATYPAISVLSRDVTINGGRGDVVAVDSFAFVYCESAEIFIFNDGIESISEFFPTASGVNMKAKEVRLPSTLKVLEDSFNMTDSKLTSLLLPEGLEVIIDCFWSDMIPAIGIYRENGQNITITVPSTVTNIVAVPKNLDLSQNDRFEYDGDGRLYHINGDSKILCSEYQSHVADGRLAVEEGVTGVQVYLLSTLEFDYLDLPSTFCEVGYNNAAENYDAYTGNLLTPQSVINNPSAEPSTAANKKSYAIISELEKITYVAINRTDMPVSDYAFVSSSGVPHNGSMFENDVKVVLVGKVATGSDVEITVTVAFSRDNELRTQKLTGYQSGDTLTVEDILAAVDVSADDYNIVLSNIGKVYDGGVLTSDMYITVECYAKPGGFTYEVNADGKTATVTGADLSTAESLVDGSYRVVIDMIDGYVITAIADGAFNGVSGLSEVYIANTVTTIGAEAFKNTANLRLVDFAPGGLEVIGKSAFENAGCVQDNAGNWIVNTDGGVTKLTMILPLADLIEIQPYAFKTKAIKEFTAVKGEEERTLLYADETTLKEGGFMFAINGNGKNRGIVKYIGINEEKTMMNSSGEDTLITVRGVQLVAIAGGGDFSNASAGLALGFSYRYFDDFAAYINPALSNNVYEFEVMEGSVYFGGEKMSIYFGLVSKIHKNAFTDMEDAAPGIYYYNCSYDQHMTIEQVQEQDTEIFEEGWFEGRSNSENAFMEETEAQTSKYPVM